MVRTSTQRPASTTTSQPLSGIRVVDLTRIYSGPYCTFLMALAGAEVIKVETPEGEHLRHRNARGGAGLPFAMLNANKRLVTVDYKQPEGRALLMRLIATADVLVENFRPGVMNALGLDRDSVRAVNPRLIYASTSGFGEEGPYRDLAAMDLTIQALSGAIATTGFPDGTPVKTGPAFGDFSAGIHLYAAIVTALLHRERTGEALSPEISMLESMYTSLCSNLGAAMSGKEQRPSRTGNRHGGLSMCPYNVYPTTDGQIAIICSNDRHWDKLTAALGRPDLGEDLRLKTMEGRVAHMDFVDSQIAGETAKQGKDALFALLSKSGVPCGPVRDLPEVMADPQLRHTGMLKEVNHPEYGSLVLPHTPLRYRGEPRADYVPSGRLGADNETIWTSLGVDAEEFARLREAGII